MSLTTYEVCRILTDSANSRKLKSYFEKQLELANDTEPALCTDKEGFKDLLESHVLNDVLPVRTMKSKMQGKVMADGKLWNPLINRRWLPYHVISNVSDAMAYKGEIQGLPLSKICQDEAADVSLNMYLGLLWPTFFDSKYRYYTHEDKSLHSTFVSLELLRFWKRNSEILVCDTSKLARELSSLSVILGYPYGIRFSSIEYSLSRSYTLYDNYTAWSRYFEKDLWAINQMEESLYNYNLRDRFCISGLVINNEKYTLDQIFGCEPVVNTLPWGVFVHLYALTGFWSVFHEVKSNPDFMYGEFKNHTEIILQCEKALKTTIASDGFITIQELAALNLVLFKCIKKMLSSYMHDNIHRAKISTHLYRGIHRSESMINQFISSIRNKSSFDFRTAQFTPSDKFDMSKYLQKLVSEEDGVAEVSMNAASTAGRSVQTEQNMGCDLPPDQLDFMEHMDELNTEVRNILTALYDRFSVEDVEYIVRELNKHKE